ncbi:MAG TPA: hypothetical protein VGX50_04270 [Longimicrobium sp.]|jgi:hypothetical protein|nr:hypothetical protein [Longimicrobium sp.]
MSVFSYPRINFAGTITLNPGTANNDDYAQAPGRTMPANWGAFAGQPFGLFDSGLVQARTFGMSDEAFVEWVQRPYIFDGGSRPVMPSEWNYYGDMSSNAQTTVVGVQAGPGESYTKPDPSVPLSSAIGQALTFKGGITDVNSEGSPPSTQFFIDALQLATDQVTVKGAPSKGACQWINFYRNVNLTADGGAGGYIYHVLRAGPNTTINIPGMPANAVGVVIRYYLYRTIQGETNPFAQAALYSQGKQNPATLQIAGTIAPLMPDEAIITGPVGRLLVSSTTPIPTPPGTQNNGGGQIGLAPAVLQQDGTTISADFIGTFPEFYQGSVNPKYDFGPVSLVVKGGGITAPVGPVPYADTDGGNACGWVFDFDISSNPQAQQALQDANAAFSLVHPQFGTVLDETPYYFPSNQQGIYAEQHGPGDQFLNQGTVEPATVSVYSRGKLLSREKCPPITVWAYQSTPIQSPGNAFALNSNFKPGDPLSIDTLQSGNLLLTFTINGPGNPAPGGYPPQNYSAFSFPPYVTNNPLISIRILPNDEDFSRYYVDPAADEPVGNDLLTFDVVYQKVLRTYYLLFPAMNRVFPLNCEEKVTKNAQAILARTEMSLWMTTKYMPRTRDMSASRRKLLRAWCRKVAPTAQQAAGPAESNQMPGQQAPASQGPW